MRVFAMVFVLTVLGFAGCKKKDGGESGGGPSIKAIFAEWKADKAGAKAKFAGKPVSTQGLLTGVYNDASGLWANVSVPEVDGNKNQNVKCYLDEASHEKARKMPQMKDAKAKGTFAFEADNFVLKNCTLP